jgi:hypothetical protein
MIACEPRNNRGIYFKIPLPYPLARVIKVWQALRVARHPKTGVPAHWTCVKGTVEVLRARIEH